MSHVAVHRGLGSEERFTIMSDQTEQLEWAVEEYGGYVKAVAMKLAPHPAMVDDIAQQVFLEFCKKKDRWDFDQPIKPLLAQMTRFVAKRAWRDCSKEMGDLVQHIATLASEVPDEPWYGDDEKEALQHCLENAPDKSRRLIEASYTLGLNSIEISERMRMNADAVRQALFRIRSKLRKCLELRLGASDA
jgi:RNA polymerase sigma factor (sigma-70 family)